LLDVKLQEKRLKSHMKIKYDVAAFDGGCSDPAPLTSGGERGAIARQSKGEGAIGQVDTRRGRMSTSAREVAVTTAHGSDDRASAPVPISLHVGSCTVIVRYRSPSRLNLERRHLCPR
jgi:hypothetical protein